MLERSSSWLKIALYQTGRRIKKTLSGQNAAVQNWISSRNSIAIKVEKVDEKGEREIKEE